MNFSIMSIINCAVLQGKHLETTQIYMCLSPHLARFCIKYAYFRNEKNCPAGIWCQNDVVSTSMRRQHVASTFVRRHFYVMCPLGDKFQLNEFKILKSNCIESTSIVSFSTYSGFQNIFQITEQGLASGQKF